MPQSSLPAFKSSPVRRPLATAAHIRIGLHEYFCHSVRIKAAWKLSSGAHVLRKPA